MAPRFNFSTLNLALIKKFGKPFYFFWIKFMTFLTQNIDLRLNKITNNFCALRSCVLLSVLGFRVILRNYTAYRKKRPKIWVYFLYRYQFQKGFPFKNKKMFWKFLQNRLTKTSETPVFLCPKISKMFKNSGLNTFDWVDSIESIRSGRFDRVI